ncbi:MAG: sigma 54-interacting transcriptional regulator [Candidatus Eisenbacteria bacterium]
MTETPRTGPETGANGKSLRHAQQGDSVRPQPELVHLLLEAARNYIEQRKGAAAEECAAKALAMFRAGDASAAPTDETRSGVATALSLLGSAREIQGSLGGAEAALQEAREIQERAGDHVGAAETYTHLASLRRTRGDLREAREFLLTSLRYSASAPPGPVRARALEDLCPVERRLGDPESSRERLEEALRIRESLGQTKEMAIDLDHLGNIELSQGRLGEAVSHYERALSLFDKLGHRGGSALVSNNLGLARMHRGEYDLAAARFERARSLYTDLGDERRLAWSVGNLGLLASYRGQVVDARTFLEESLTRIERVGDRLGKATFLNNLSMALRMSGELSSAVETARRSIETMTEAGLVEGSASPWTNLSLAELERGNLAGAREAAAQVYALTQSSTSPGTRCDRLILEATVALHAEEFDAAASLGEEAHALAESSRQPRERAETLRLLGEAQLRSGNVQSARTSLLAAHAACRNLGDLYQTALARLLLGELFLSVDSVEAAGRHLRQAADMFHTIGNRRQRWKALLLLARAEWPLSQSKANATIETARQLAREDAHEDERVDRLEELARLEASLRSGGERSVAVEGSLRDITEICNALREAPSVAVGVARAMDRVATRHSLESVRVVWEHGTIRKAEADDDARIRKAEAGEPDREMELLAQTAWASGLAQYAWPPREGEQDDEFPFVVAVPILARNGNVLGLFLARGAEDSAPESPRPPRLWWFLRAVGEALSLFVVAAAAGNAGAGGEPGWAIGGVSGDSGGAGRSAFGSAGEGARGDEGHGSGRDDSCGDDSRSDGAGGSGTGDGRTGSTGFGSRARAASNEGRRASAQRDAAGVSGDFGAADDPGVPGDPVEPTFAGLVGDSPSMRALYQAIERVAPTDSTVLIQGESGTGKELVARAIHANGPRRTGPFVAIACPSIPRELIEAELFGHEKGAFTGANARRQGQVQLANGGTLFLDEIGDIDIPTQTKLLRFLQEREFVPVGGQHPVKVDIRLVAATSRNLEEEVKQGRLREDLYYRLSVVPMRLVPLRERAADVPALVRYFLDQMATREGMDRVAISKAALDALVGYPWPGNVRELRNVIEYLVALHQGKPLRTEDLPEKLLAGTALESTRFGSGPSGSGVGPGAVGVGGQSAALRQGETLEARLMAVEGGLIRETIERCGGNQSKAARLLGLKESTMRAKMKRYGISGAAQRSSRRASKKRTRDGQGS